MDATTARVAGYALVDTALGTISLEWSAAGLTRLRLPWGGTPSSGARAGPQSGSLAEPDGEDTRPPFVPMAVHDIIRYARGEAVDFSGVPLDFGAADRFRVAIYAAARSLPYGQMTTYAALASAAGHPGMARETGVALGRNPVAIIVPCHRIVAAGGRLGGFSAPGGPVTKQKLLAMERAQPIPTGKAQASFVF